MADQRDRERIEAWRAVRAKGIWHYIVFRGLLFWGLTMFILMAIVLPAVRGERLEADLLILNAAVWSLGGLMWGGLTFLLNDKMIQNKEKDL